MITKESQQRKTPINYKGLLLRKSRAIWSPSYIYQFSVRVVQVVSSGLAPYRLPRALDNLLIYQQPSSTTLYRSYLETPYLIDGRQEQWDEETIRPALSYRTVLDIRGLYGASLSS